ncbi:MAG: FecR domain-containing protein [Verrucomicrobia bacterium]|nr:FecR domain-containing protein [Verrucomicrobiota bacterium]
MRPLIRPLFLLLASCLCFLTAPAQTVRVLTVSGEATIQPADGSPARPIVVGDTVTLGTRIVTAANGRVVITPFPGIKSIIAPSSNVTIEKISETKATGSNVALQQAVLNLKSGAVVSDLEKQEGIAYDYAIRTPRGVAGARGTTYTVAVAPSGVESVIVTDGRIQITLTSGATYNLAPGQASVSRPGAPETAISNASELPPADKKLLQTTLESSLGEIAKAIESGVDLKPATLKSTLEFAGKMGIELDPELIKSLQPALEKEKPKGPPEEKPKPKPADSAEENKNNQPPENKEAKQIVSEQQDPILTAYLADLNLSQRVEFLALPPATRTQLLGYYQSTPLTLRANFARSPFAIQTLLLNRALDFDLRDFALTRAGDGNARSVSEITYYLSLATNARPAFLALTLAAQRATAAYFDQLPAGLRPAFLTAAAEVQTALLADAADAALAKFALTPASDGAIRTLAEIAYFNALPDARHVTFLALSITDQRATVAYFNQLPAGLRAAFLAGSPDTQALLVKRATDTDLATFALATANRTDSEIALYSNLPDATRTAYLQRPADIRSLLLQRDDIDLAILALSPDRTTGTLLTDNDLRDALLSLNSLSPAAFALFKEFAGGSGLPNIDNAPSPSRFSPAAYERTLTSWNALTAAQRATFLQLGAGESIMDTSATYLSAVAASFSQQPALYQTTMTETGWGAVLTEILANKGLQTVLENASTLSPAQRALIKELQLGPYAFEDSYYIPNGSTSGSGSLTLVSGGSASAVFAGGLSTAPIANVTSTTPATNNTKLDYLNALGALNTADRAILKRLDLQDDLIKPGHNLVDYPTLLQTTIGFYNQLTPAERDFLVGLQAGSWLWTYAPTDTVYGPMNSATQAVSATDYIRTLLQSLSTLTPVEKDALRDLELFSNIELTDKRLTPASVVQILAAYLNAPATVQPLLRAQLRGDAWFDSVIGANGEYQTRPIAEVIAILGALTPVEISALRDMQIGGTLAYGGFFDADTDANATVTPTQQLKNMVAVYRSLGDLEKFTLRELGIVKSHDNNFAAFLADPQGLTHLLKAYAALPGSIRAETRQIENSSYNQTYAGRSFFAPKASTNIYAGGLYDVSFTSDDDLYIGAPRVLRIQRGYYTINDTFTTGVGKSLYLRAGDLVHLTDTTFSTNIRSIVIEAATVHLKNVDFPGGSTIALNSKFGGTNALGAGSGTYPVFLGTGAAAQFGRVNFDDVRYNGNPLHDVPSYDAHGVNIRIGTLANPAVPAATAIPVPAGNLN